MTWNKIILVGILLTVGFSPSALNAKSIEAIATGLKIYENEGEIKGHGDNFNRSKAFSSAKRDALYKAKDFCRDRIKLGELHSTFSLDSGCNGSNVKGWSCWVLLQVDCKVDQ